MCKFLQVKTPAKGRKCIIQVFSPEFEQQLNIDPADLRFYKIKLLLL